MHGTAEIADLNLKGFDLIKQLVFDGPEHRL